MSIKIRKAQENDAPFLAQMILKSTRAGKKIGMFDLIFESKDDKEVLENLQKLVKAKTKNHCQFANFLVAEADGKSVGTLCTYEPRIVTQEKLLEALREIGCDGNLEEKLADICGCNFEPNNRTLMFDFMEELDDYRDEGVLKALTQKSLLTARLKGYRIVQAVVEIGSLETKLYYEKLGFREVETKKCEVYQEKFGREGLVLFEMEF